MKIAHLILGGEVRGGEIVALELARAALSRGDEVLFLSPSRGDFTRLVEGEGMVVHCVDVSRTFHLGAALALARLLRRERVTILHTHAAIAANVLGRAAGRLSGVPVVSHLHIENHLPRNAGRAFLLRGLDNATVRLAARVVVVSEDTRRALAEQGYPERSMQVVPNGIHLVANSDNATGRRMLAELGVPADVPVVGEVARLCEVKGQRVLIDALAQLPGVHTVLVGDDLEAGGAFRAALERQAEELGVRDRVVFTGYRPSGPILAGIDIFVLPSFVEGLPLTVLEAMAHSKPVVASAVGGTPEAVVEGETGLLVPPRDPDRLAGAIRRLVDDPELARRLGAAGRSRVAERFSVEAMTTRVLEIYDDIAAR